MGDTREEASDWIQGFADGFARSADALPSEAKIPVALIASGLTLVATLVRQMGISDAEELLRELSKNPVPIITRRELDAQTHEVILSFETKK